MIDNLKKTSLLLAYGTVIALSPTFAHAQVMGPVAASAAATQLSPDAKFVQDLGEHAISIITDKSLTQPQREAKYSQILHDAFDLKTIGHFVIGHAWDQATPEQQQEYMTLFEQLVVKIYGDRLNFYSGESFHIKGSRQENEKDTIVNSEIAHPDGSKPTTIDWRVRDRDGKPMIIDVVVEGVSQSVTQRQEYSSVIQRDGGKLDGLIDLMHKQLQGTATPAVAK